MLKNIQSYKMSVPYREYMANAGENGILSSTRQSVNANLSDNHLKKANINLNIVVPNLDNNGIQAQAQAQNCGTDDCVIDQCESTEYCESSSSCESSSVYECKKKDKCKKYEYVVKKNKHKHGKKKCYGGYNYWESSTSWFDDSCSKKCKY